MSFGGKYRMSSKDQIASKDIKFKIPFPRGSILKMESYAGNIITHSIESEDVRVPTASITFRKVDKQKKRVTNKNPQDTSQVENNHKISEYFFPERIKSKSNVI